MKQNIIKKRRFYIVRQETTADPKDIKIVIDAKTKQQKT
jgi:hypothetical protein